MRRIDPCQECTALKTRHSSHRWSLSLPKIPNLSNRPRMGPRSMAQRSTRELVTNGATKYQIGTGYDKFFNPGEVPWTAVRSFILFFCSGR